MPRTNDPGTLATGPGYVTPAQVRGATEVRGSTAPLPATEVTTTDFFGRWVMGRNVEGVLNELASLVPPSMGPVGSVGVPWLGSDNTGVPDWGVLKLVDGRVTPTGNVAADVSGVYPYYYRSPISDTGVGATGNGLDATTDPTFNYYDAAYPSYTGGGPGVAHAGFASLPMDGGPAVGYPVWRVVPATSDLGVVVSGVVSPADRGVLALLHWPYGDLSAPTPATTTSEVLTRCVAATLLGQGVGGEDGSPGGAFVEASGGTRAVGSIDFTTNPAAPYTVTLDLTSIGGGVVVFTALTSPTSDPRTFARAGSAAATATNFAKAVNTLYFPERLTCQLSGSLVTVTIVAPGEDGNDVTFASSSMSLSLVQPSGGTNGDPSPYGFPGRAAGQYNLDEVHRGISDTGGTKPVYNPAAGQVRLLSDPTAFPAAGTPTTAGGIPILGATPNAVGTGSPTILPYGLGGGTTGNFFAYRLPYLRSYTTTDGCIYTPTAEKVRYATKLPPASPGALTNYGDYDGFTADFWAYQVARYRHRFAPTNGPTSSLRRGGSYAVVHFKTEAAFEGFVRDGVVPATTDLYSVHPLSWSGIAQVDNLATTTTTPVAAAPYTIQRSEIVEDPHGANVPTLVAGSGWSFGSTLDVMWCSGIRYLVPRAPGSASAPAFGITTLTFTLNGLFDATYRSHDKVPTTGPLAGDHRKYALNMNPVFVSLSSFTFTGTENPVVTGISLGSMDLFKANLGEARRQRVELGYADLTNGTTNPTTGTSAMVSATQSLSSSITFNGDTDTPVFTRDARVRVFVRRPLAVVSTPGPNYQYPLPTVGGNSPSNRGFTIPATGGDTVLYHSMRETNSGVETVPYGNPATPAKATFNTTKDRSERFLDEVYRYPLSWAPNPNAGDVARLVGEGLPGGVSPVNVPVRPINGDPNFPGWYFQSIHTDASYLLTNRELQVTGWPARNPPASEGLLNPQPSRGVLVYPQTNYTTGFTPAGADYSAMTGLGGYVRAFDAGIANVGATTVRFKLWGVNLSTFAYAAPDPGSANMAVLVKVPGKTTWMDAGRTDGSGPSKQDALLDGAGCLVAGSNTFDGVDNATQLAYACIEVNVGATGALFANTETPARCPILVAIVLYDTAGARALNLTQGGEDGPTSVCRGLVGIDLL